MVANMSFSSLTPLDLFLSLIVFDKSLYFNNFYRIFKTIKLSATGEGLGGLDVEMKGGCVRKGAVIILMARRGEETLYDFPPMMYDISKKYQRRDAA